MPENAYLALVANKNFLKRKRGGHRISGPSKKNPFQGISFAKNDIGIKFFYCGRVGHIARDFYKKNKDENRYRHKRHTGHFAGEDMNHDLKLYMSNATLSTKIYEARTWFVDSVSSNHMTCNKHWYENFKETNNVTNIDLGDDKAYQIKRYGNILVMLTNDTIRHINNVMYVPRIKNNLMDSVSMITDHNLKIEFFKPYCVVKDLLDHSKLVESGVKVEGLYKLKVTSMPHQALTSNTMTAKNI